MSEPDKEQICLNVDSKLLEKAKIKAIKEKTKLSYFFEEKLREWIK